jgi:type I restriction enzyme M protein
MNKSFDYKNNNEFRKMNISEILKDTDYKLDQFRKEQIQKLSDIIEVEIVKGVKTPYIQCLVRQKKIKLTPEEIVRQLYIMKLNEEYDYPLDLMRLEHNIKSGSKESIGRADIVIMSKDRKSQEYIIVETKKPKRIDGQKQLESYCNSRGASIGVWTNGESIEHYYSKDSKTDKTRKLEKLTNLPKYNESLSDVLNAKYTIKDLIIGDKLKEKTLKDTIQEFEDVVMANSGVDSFEEIFKIIFTKLYDEFLSGDDMDEISTLQRHNTNINDINDDNFRRLEFRDHGTDKDVVNRLNLLFENAKKQWKGIFSNDATFKLSNSHLRTCISYLQDIKLFNSNLDVVDDAFEYLVTKEQKGNKGQYFTPRYVIDMCVKMLDPKPEEKIIDTAAGSCGFPMHSIFHVWKKLNPNKENLFSSLKRSKAETDYVQNNVFGIDFDLKSVRVGRTLNLIAGDGQTNVLLMNTLDYTSWDESTKEQVWVDDYNDGWKKLRELRTVKNSNKSFEFDIVLANPPFAGDISERHILDSYELGMKANGKSQTKVGRDILFIERNLDFLKPGGRMAVVLPQGRFNNSSDKHIRDFIAERCRILGVVGLHGNVFKPHTGTKTSVLFVQKWDEELCPRVEDYPIFFATMQEPSKDNSGDKIYVKDEDGKNKLDSHGHLIVKHDLYNHDGLTQDGIAEAFIEFAKKENLSFVGKN